jgi:hypothetical protein
MAPRRKAGFLIEHDLFGKPLHSFPDHAAVANAKWKDDKAGIGAFRATQLFRGRDR